jgi:hypothetical protein
LALERSLVAGLEDVFSLLFKVGDNETGSPWAQTGIRSQIEIPLFMLDIVDRRIIEEL